MGLLYLFVLSFVYVKIKTKKHYLHIKPLFFYIVESLYQHKKNHWIYYTERYYEGRDINNEKKYTMFKY